MRSRAVLAGLALLAATTIEAVAGPGSGSASISPPSDVSVGDTGTWTVTYTAAEAFTDGRIRLTIPVGWTTPQLSTPTAAGYVTVTDDDPAGTVTPSISVQDIIITADILSPGSTITILYGNDGGGSQPGAAAAAIERLRSRIESVSKDYESAQRRLSIVNLYNESLQLYNQGEYQRALENLDQVLSLQPDHADARRLRALANRKLTPLTADEKAQIRRLYLAGMQFFANDEYAKAISEWEKILEIDPTNESVQRNIDEARQRLRQLENG